VTQRTESFVMPDSIEHAINVRVERRYA
jgi:hypothetical protein